MPNLEELTKKYLKRELPQFDWYVDRTEHQKTLIVDFISQEMQYAREIQVKDMKIENIGTPNENKSNFNDTIDPIYELLRKLPRPKKDVSYSEAVGYNEAIYEVYNLFIKALHK